VFEFGPKQQYGNFSAHINAFSALIKAAAIIKERLAA
jgi:hypothetical protein